MKPKFQKFDTRLWLAIVGSATIVLVTAYAVAQQVTRLSANDQPLILTQSISHWLDAGYPPVQIVSSSPVDLRTDIIPFAIIVDSNQKVLASSATLGDVSLLPPPGIFTYAKAHGSDSFTWQPEPGVRLATVVKSYKQGSKYIIAGQSLKQVAVRVEVYAALAFLAWLGVLIWVSLALAWHPR